MKSFIRFIFFLFLIALIVIGILGYIGVLPWVSHYLGTDQPRDLGIKYTDKIFDEAGNKTGVDAKILPPTDNPADSISYMGKHPVNKVFSSQELTALVSDRPWKYYPVSKTQIKIGKDGLVEISGLIRTDRVLGYILATGGSKIDLSIILSKIKFPKGLAPFYIAGTSEVKNNSVSLNINKLELGRLPIPNRLINPNINYIKQFIEERLEFVKGAYVEKLNFKDGKMNFVGTLPDLEGTTRE